MTDFELFKDLEQDELQQVLAITKPLNFSTGELIFREGDRGRDMVLIESGKVAVFITNDQGQEVILSEIGPGNFLGEMSMLENVPRSASCRGVSPGKVLVLSGSQFFKFQARRGEIGVKILRRMLRITTERLLNTGGLVTRLVQFGEESRRRAVTDTATGLYNRRYFDGSFEELFSNARATGKPLSLGMFDMDHFGDLNKIHGQDFGDRVIIAAAQVFREALSPTDILVRYGGDEFLFLFPNTSADQALIRCQKVNEGIRRLSFSDKSEVQLTCSLGIAEFPTHAMDPKDLRDRADQALYQAKEAGRDRSVVFQVALK